jgi:thiamine transporter
MKAEPKGTKLTLDSERPIRSRTKLLAEMAVAIALGTVLSLVKFSIWPEGGSITAGSMIPLFWFSLRRGAKLGVTAGVAYGVVQFFAGPFFVHPAQLLLDYPVAFGALGLAGLLPKHELAGVALGVGGRFLAHFVSGVIFFATYAPAVYLGIDIGANAYTYSALYNGSYLLPELVISLVLMEVVIRRGIIDLYK